MTEQPLNTDPDRARLEMNARGHRHDPEMERLADLFHTDRAAWNQLPTHLQSIATSYADMREHYRAAVAAGVITEQETPNAH